MRPKKENRPALVATSSEAEKQYHLPFNHIAPAVCFSYPNIETLQAITLALVLKGYEVDALSFIYGGELNATRLAAYIERLRKLGLGKRYLISERLPLTSKQCARRKGPRFAKYWLVPEVIKAAGDTGQKWAKDVLSFHKVSADVFPFSKAWITSIGGAQ